MALSKNPQPIEPLYPRFSKGSASAVTRVHRVDASETIVKGDLLVIVGNKLAKATAADDFIVTGSDVAGIVGVALGDITTGASPTRDNVLSYADAYANVFAANMLVDDTTDFTMVDYTKFFTDLPINNVLVNSKSVWYVDSAVATNDSAIVYDIVRKAGDDPADSPVNPRVAFTFKRALLWNGLY